MTIYYAILTHNRSESLINLLKSIQSQTIDEKTEKKIIIWDNASSKDHREKFLNSEFSQDSRVNYIYSEVNSFMVGKLHLEKYILANYQLTKDDFVAHLDDDVRLDSEWTKYTLQTCLSNKWEACGSVEYWKGSLIYSGQSKLHFDDIPWQDKNIPCWVWQWEEVVDLQHEKQVRFAGHRAILVKSNAFIKVQHDPNLLIGGEDLDYSLALIKQGYTIGIHPKALIHHRSMGEVDAKDFRTHDKIIPSWKHFYKKWGFVRKNVNTELSITIDQWLDLLSQWS